MKTHSSPLHALLLGFLATWLTAPGIAAASTSQDLDRRLELLVNELEKKRLEYHIPGMSLAVVVEDDVVLVEPFGLAQLDPESAVTRDTVFAIGSVTKSFTSGLVAQLVDEELMDWDAPITDYLPDFVLDIDVPGSGSDRGEDTDARPQVLVRDLLSHRTGFTRMHLLAVNNSLSPEQTLAAAVNAVPWKPFREAFLYNNVQYLATGHAAGKRAESDWFQAVEERLFEPLGMRSSFTSLKRVPADRVVASGYAWDEDKEEFEPANLRIIDNIGPAGSILSTAEDMARWVRVHLGRGEFEDKLLISRANHDVLWEAHIKIGPESDYGLGWMLHGGEELDVVEHGGNVSGGCAQLALFPKKNAGFVLLMNVSASVLQQESIQIVRRCLFEDIADESAEGVDTAPYVGNYIGNFATFEDETFEVSEKDGKLAVDVPGQMVYQLEPPDEEGKWQFSLTDQIHISFEFDEDSGDVIGMRFHQAGLTFELPREGYDAPVEIPLIELEPYVGRYHCEEHDITTKFLIHNKRLAVDWPKEMIYELYPPDEEGLRFFRVTDRFRLRFEETDEGRVTGFKYFQGDLVLDFERLADSDSEPLPSLDELHASRGSSERQARLEELGDFHFVGVFQFLQSGLSGTTVTWADSKGRFRAESDSGEYGWMRFGITEDQGLLDFSFLEPDEIKAADRERMRFETPLAWVGDWRVRFEKIRILKADVHEGRPCWILRVENPDDPPHTITVDQEFGDVVHVETLQPIPGTGSALPVKQDFEDFREFEGLRIPMRTSVQNDMTGTVVQAFETVEARFEKDDAHYVIEPRERPKPWIAPRAESSDQ